MKKTIFLLSFVVLGYMIFAGQVIKDDSPRWNQRPEMMRMGPPGNYIPLPQPQSDNYVNPNTTTHIFYSPDGVAAVSPNFRVHPTNSPGTQSETPIYASLTNPNYMFASANIFWGGSYFSCGGYISTNGGLNWFGGDTTVRSSGDPGPIIDKDNRYIISFITTSYSMGSSFSTNFGLNWAPTVTFPGATTNADKNLSGTNNAASSPYYGHSYTVYTEFGGSYTNRIVFSRTTDGGVSWSTVSPVSPPTSSGHHHQGCDVTAGPEGNVYAVWANCITNAQNSTEDSLGFAKSTDDGTTWVIATNHAADMNGIRAASFGPWGIRVAGFPRVDIDRSGGPRNGWIYVVAPQKTGFQDADAADIFLWRSSDLGVTWSAGIRVNQDAVGSGKLQYHAAVNVDAGGGVNVVYHDCRNSNSNDSVDTYVNRSVDGGNTWTEIKVNDAKFRPAYISGLANGYQGDYIGITSGNNRIFPYWADNRVGRYQAWTAIVDIGPSIAHTPLGNTEQISSTRAVNCVITPAGSPINPTSVKLYYSKDNPTLTSNITMTNSSGDNWTANLPLSGAGLYRYYITATDNISRTATYPSGAPANTISFTASSDTTRPVITHTPIGDFPKTNWPAVVTATVTDNIGVDSVWVKWYKNTPATIKQFKLPNAGGSVYSAAFNSIPADVDYNDSIFYRVFARDSSSNHNADSTALYKFKIINLTNICIGTGTVQMGSASGPFNTYWYGNRTQFLWTASEILANSGVAGNIMKIGFNIATVGGQAMTGFNIRMQHTALTTLTGFTSTGWTTVFTGSYTVAGTGWQYIDLQTPYFFWNGTGNLLVEICYGNSSYTTATVVNGTTIAGMEYSEYHDISTACATFVAPTAQTARANVCFVITTPLVGIIPNNGNVPTKYNLSQNYPNPFNPTTQIRYDIPKQTFVTMKVYDLLGREITKLVNEVKQPGNYIVDFNASSLSSGVYFYKLEAGEFESVKRMVLVK